MKIFKSLCCAIVCASSLCSCESLRMPQTDAKTGTGVLSVHFEGTRAALPDTNSFIMTVTDSKGKAIYSGLFSAMPENIAASPGTYTVTAISRDFTAPLFDAPQYGDTEVAVVKSGQTCNVVLYCAQMNAGIKLNVDRDFLTAYPNAVIYLKSDLGRLMWGYTEKRIAYFKPGKVSVVLNDAGMESVLLTRTLEAQQVLVLGLQVSSGLLSDNTTRAGIHIQIDTTRNWVSDSFEIGGKSDGEGSDKSSALSVSQAKDNIGAIDTWVYGFIVGGDLSSANCSFEAPFNSKTNLVIASKTSCTDKSACMSVQLGKGDVRDALNLVDHEELLGKKVFLKGDIVEAYYGIPGIQSITEYSF